jgi:hypothetical protein
MEWQLEEFKIRREGNKEDAIRRSGFGPDLLCGLVHKRFFPYDDESGSMIGMGLSGSATNFAQSMLAGRI